MDIEIIKEQLDVYKCVFSGSDDPHDMFGFQLLICAKIHLESLQQRIEQLEDEQKDFKKTISNQIESYSKALNYNNDLESKVKQLEDVIWAKDQLLIGYRIGKQPPEKAFNIIDKYKAQKALEEK